MTTITGLRGMLLTACAAMLAPGAMAQATTVIKDGIAQLPTSGFVIDLKAKPGIDYHVSGSWALDKDVQVYDSRDVIDEIDPASGDVVSGNWVMTAYFDAGGCQESLAGIEMDDVTYGNVTTWNEDWLVSTGRFDLGGAFGKVGTAVFCRTRENKSTLIMYHFAVREPAPRDRQGLIASALASSALSGTSFAYTNERSSSIFPTKRRDVRNRGTVSHIRDVRLPVSGLNLTIPDDGFVWLDNEGDGVDFLDRVLPSMPALSVELIYVAGYTCAGVFETFTSDTRPDHAPLVIPAGWVGGPTLLVENQTELTLCNQRGADALVVGVFQGETNRDVSSLHPLLAALAAATR
jgi:hypothetical protein